MCAEAARAPLKVAELPELNDPTLYLNRELSHLEFQRRVLEEARDRRNPLLERVKFLSIFGSNIDEFFMVRVAGVMQQIENGVQETGMDGRGPSETLDAIRASVGGWSMGLMSSSGRNCSRRSHENHVRLMPLNELSRDQRAQLDTFFAEKVFPVLTPLAFDPGRPFPHISNLSLNIAVAVREPGGGRRALCARQGSRQLAPTASGGDAGERSARSPRLWFVWLEQLIIANLHHLFPGLEILRAHVFHLTRDAEVAIKELETDDLLETIEEAVWQRRFRDAVRLQVDARMPARDDRFSGRQAGVGCRQHLSRARSAGSQPVAASAGAGPAGFKRQALSRAHPTRLYIQRRRCFRRDPPAGSVAASSLRILPAGGGISAQSRQRSGCAGDQDDALSAGPQLADRGGACSKRWRTASRWRWWWS